MAWRRARMTSAQTAAYELHVDRVLETPVRLLRVVWAWPDGPDPGRRPWPAFAARHIISTAFCLIAVTSAAWIASGEYDNIVNALSNFNDVVASVVVVVKVQSAFHYGRQLLAMRTSLQHSFSAVESMLAPDEARDANLRCTRKARSFSRWMLLFYALVCSSGLGINLANVALSREHRQLNIKAPAAVTRSDWLYFPLFTCTMIMFSSFVFISGGSDTMFFSLCMHLRCKCEILQKLFRQARRVRISQGTGGGAGPGGREHGHWEDDGRDFGPPPGDTTARMRTDREVEVALAACARYHQLIVQLRDTTEQAYSHISFILMAYLLLGLGIPALRVLYDKSMDSSAAVFLILYTSWNFSQLLFYCWFADKVAAASAEVSVAAYAAFRPDRPAGPLCGLSGPAGATLNLVTLRAQRPLYLTAGRLVNITLSLYLEIIRRTQSIYSYLLKLA